MAERTMRVTFLLIFSAILCLLQRCPAEASAAQPITGAELEEVAPKIVRVGFSSRILADIDPRDAQAAMELWTRELTRSMGVKRIPQTIIFDDNDSILAALKRGELSIVSLTAIDYLKLREKSGLIPSVIAPNHVGRGRELLLVARKDSGIEKFTDLRGKTINLLPAKKQEITNIWLDVLLMRHGYTDRSQFFRQVKESASASQAIMAVFFRQSDAAIVNRAVLESSTVLNPQIGNQLLVVSESKPLIGDLTCIPNKVNDKFRQAIEYAALHLHERPVGKQILTLFHIERVVPFQESYIEGTVELLRERDRLLVRVTRKR